jgi:hypothetical protein
MMGWRLEKRRAKGGLRKETRPTSLTQYSHMRVKFSSERARGCFISLQEAAGRQRHDLSTSLSRKVCKRVPGAKLPHTPTERDEGCASKAVVIVPNCTHE